MQPARLPLYPGAGLVTVNDRRAQELLLDLLFDLGQSLVASLIGPKPGALGKGLAEQVLK
jgi:hypothetical protein